MNNWIDAERRVERAQLFCETQRWPEALAEMDAAVSSHPENAAWQTLRGYLLHVLGRNAEAADAYESALALESDDREVTLVLALALARLGRTERAIAVLEGLSSRHASFEPAYCNRIYLYAELEEHDRADEMFYQAQQLNERCPHCFYSIGTSLLARGATERALFCFRRVLELGPNYRGVHRRIAQCAKELGRLTEACHHFLEEYRQDPRNTDVLFEWADSTAAAGDADSAAEKLKHILDIDPSHAEARFALGKLWLDRGHPDKAIECFEAIRVDDRNRPSLPELTLRQGLALFQLGRFPQALRCLEEVAQQETNQVDVQLRVGDCMLALQNLPKAEACYRRALAVSGRCPIAHYSLGLCLLRMGRHLAGLRHCRRSFRLMPDNVLIARTIVLAYFRLGRWAEANIMLRRALAFAPKDESLRGLKASAWRYRLRHYLVLLEPLKKLVGSCKPRRGPIFATACNLDSEDLL